MPYSNNFLSNLAGIMSNKPVVHHSHVSGKIIGFVHDFCNQKVRETITLFLLLLTINFVSTFSFSRKDSDLQCEKPPT